MKTNTPIRIELDGYLWDTFVSYEGNLCISCDKDFREKKKRFFGRHYGISAREKLIGYAARKKTFPIDGTTAKRPSDQYKEENCPESRTLLTLDVKNPSRENWDCILEQLYITAKGLTSGEQWARSAYKMLRVRHNESKVKTWDQCYPDRVVRWAEMKIRKAADGLDCVDAYRCSRVGHTAGMRRFVRDRSCCGSNEFVALCPWDLKKYRLGFNFGH